MHNHTTQHCHTKLDYTTQHCTISYKTAHYHTILYPNTKHCTPRGHQYYIIHAKTRKRDLIDKMFQIGLSISYDRVLSISTQLAQRVCRQFEHDQTVCPINLRHGLFTTSAVDNIDHNPSATTSKSSFHGTGISIFQHPSATNAGTVRQYANEEDDVPRLKMVPPIPDSYNIVPAAALDTKEPLIPESTKMKGTMDTLTAALEEENRCE